MFVQRRKVYVGEPFAASFDVDWVPIFGVEGRSPIQQTRGNETDFPADHHHFRLHSLQGFRGALPPILYDNEIRYAALPYGSFPISEPKNLSGSSRHHFEKILGAERVHLSRNFELIDKVNLSRKRGVGSEDDIDIGLKRSCAERLSEGGNIRTGTPHE
jgi:hypothetical protein